MTSIRKLSALAALLVAAAPIIAGAQKPAPTTNAAAGSNAGSNAAGKSAAAATAGDESIARTAGDDGDDDDKRIRLSGYVQPQFGVRYRPGAVPRDRTDYSAGDTRAGFIVDGSPVDKFR